MPALPPPADQRCDALDFVRRVSHRSLRSVGADWKRLFILSDGAISADWEPPMVIIAERRSTWLVASGRSRLSSLRRFLCGWNFEYTQGSNRVAGKNADSRLLAGARRAFDNCIRGTCVCGRFVALGYSRRYS